MGGGDVEEERSRAGVTGGGGVGEGAALGIFLPTGLSCAPGTDSLSVP